MLPVTVSALRLGLAVVAAALILLPAGVWSQPANDLSVDGFDAKTAYVDEHGGRYVFAPFQILTNGDWQACPCKPATQLVLVGNGLSPVTASNSDGVPELDGVSILVDGKPTRVYVASPTQVNFFLRADARPPNSVIALFYQGREIGQQVIPIMGSSPDAGTAAVNVSVEPTQVRFFAARGSEPAVHLLTTPLSFRASFDVLIEQAGGGRPFQAMLWNPRNFGAVSLVFGPEPDRRIEAVVNERGGQVTARQDLGRYESGRPYNVRVALDHGERVELAVSQGQDPGPERAAVFSSNDAPGLFEAFRPSLTVLSQSVAEANDVSLSNYRLELPHERFMTDRAGDAKILPIALALLALSAMLHAPLLLGAAYKIGGMRRVRLPSLGAGLRQWWWLVPALLAFGVGTGFLMTLGSHPFDMASQKAWTYLLVSDGFGDLYYRAQTVPLATVWKGMPFHEAVFPYGVGMAYYFYTVGWVYRLLGGTVAPDSAGLEIAIKVANLVIALADACLIYAVVRRFRRDRLALLIPVIFLLNPAVLFDITIWGETESVALFFLVGSFLMAQRSSARWAWTLLALAFLTKQTIVLPAALMAIYYLRLFPLRRTLEGFSVAVPAVMLATLPYLAAGYPPSIAIDPILGAFAVFGGNSMEKVFQVVSFDAYSVWPLVTRLRHGQHGLALLQFPDSATFIGALSYHQIGVFAFLGIAGCLALWLLVSPRVVKEPGLIFAVLAFASLTELMLPTRSIARYLVFPLVFALLSTGKAPTKGFWFVFVTLSVTSFIGMYGSVASGLESNPALAPRLAPSNNAVTYMALQVFRSDAVIITGSLLNLAALLTLAVMLWFPRREALQVPEWASPYRRIPTARLRTG